MIEATDLQGRAELLQKRIEHVDHNERKKTATLLWLGSVFGLLGFCFAYVIGFIVFLSPDITHVFYDSGYGYFPPTVSEMVHDPTEPQGKCFFAFEFIGAVFIFLSWYPMELQNVYVGDDHTFLGVSIPVIRQYLPAPGLMLVATVTTTPLAQAGTLDFFCIGIHFCGAMMMFVGYIVCEGYCIGWLCFEGSKNAKIRTEDERNQRKMCLNVMLLCLVGFIAMQVLLSIPGGPPGCCNDTWEVPKHGGADAKPELVDTASGLILLIKIISYVCEVICGLAMIASHLCIWWYCTERSYDLDEALYIYEIPGQEPLLN